MPQNSQAVLTVASTTHPKTNMLTYPIVGRATGFDGGNSSAVIATIV
jgi:hypothetical protein